MEIGTGLKQMSGEAMAQRMWMDSFFQARTLSSLLAGVTGRFVSMGRSLLCQRLPGNNQALDFLGKRRQCSRSSTSSFGLSITSRSLPHLPLRTRITMR